MIATLALLTLLAADWSPRDTPLPDIEVVTEDGARRRFPDLLAGRTVAIQFIFTSCTVSCPLQVAVFTKLQKQAADAHLLSITVDPQRDTPQALRSFATRFGGQPGERWRLVTGRPAQIERLLRALQGAAGSVDNHSRGVWVYDGRRNLWSWTQQSNSAAAIERLLREAARP